MQAQIKPYNQSELQIGIDTRYVKRKSAVELKKVNKEAKKRHNPSKDFNLTNQYLKVLSWLIGFRKRNGLTPECCELLIYVYTFYVDSSKGLTCYAIAKMLRGHSDVGSELRNTQRKLSSLVDKGLVCVVGSSDNGAYVYVPSVRTIEELREIK